MARRAAGALGAGRALPLCPLGHENSNPTDEGLTICAVRPSSRGFPMLTVPVNAGTEGEEIDPVRNRVGPCRSSPRTISRTA
jgi:hypothetical protein